MKKIEAVCFDMDGTLILNTNSVKYLCQINDKLQEVIEIEAEEDLGRYSWIDADYLKAKLIKDLDVTKVAEKFDNYIELIEGIDYVMEYLKSQGIKTTLITAGPIEVAKVIGERFNFDTVYGSYYEVKEGKYTGKINLHLGANGKKNCLVEFCKTFAIHPSNTVAIGDSSSDVEVFKMCGKSIAINYSQSLADKATEYIRTKDLKNIIKLLGCEGQAITEATNE